MVTSNVSYLTIEYSVLKIMTHIKNISFSTFEETLTNYYYIIKDFYILPHNQTIDMIWIFGWLVTLVNASSLQLLTLFWTVRVVAYSTFYHFMHRYSKRHLHFAHVTVCIRGENHEIKRIFGWNSVLDRYKHNSCWSCTYTFKIMYKFSIGGVKLKYSNFLLSLKIAPFIWAYCIYKWR